MTNWMDKLRGLVKPWTTGTEPMTSPGWSSATAIGTWSITGPKAPPPRAPAGAPPWC